MFNRMFFVGFLLLLTSPLRALAQSGNFTTDSSSPTPIPIPVFLHKGDFVDMVVLLHTTDPDENGENELLIVEQDFGVTQFGVPLYEQYVALHFDITRDGAVLDAYIPGADGDEVGTIEYSINQKQTIPRAQKAAVFPIGYHNR